MSVGELLASDLLRWMESAVDGVPRRVLMWLDPDKQFVRLLESLGGEIQTLVGPVLQSDSDRSDQLRLKLELLELEAKPEGRAVVYLPGFGRGDLEPRLDGSVPVLWGVYDYRYKGCVWGHGEAWQPGDLPEPLSLSGWLQSHGLVFADEQTGRKLSEGGSDSLLARYAVRMAKRDPDTWPRPLRFSDVEEELGGDPRETLRRLLAAPHNEVRRWGSELPIVLSRLVAEYGFALPEGTASPADSQELDAESLVDALAVQLALAEAWDAFSQPTDFPFLPKLPAKPQFRRRMAAFLRDDVLNHTELGPRFRTRMVRLEPSYDLSGWASDREGQPAGLPTLARKRWKSFHHLFETAAGSGWKAARDLLANHRDTISKSASTSWDGREGESQWGVLAKLDQLCQLAGDVVVEATGMNVASALVEAYKLRWWRIDWLHLELRAACATSGGLEPVRRVADLVHFDYASKVNQRFSELLEVEVAWPPQGLVGVDRLRETLWQDSGHRRAVILCDAVRWDLAQMILEKLSSPDSSVEALASALPSETVFGMASLVPTGHGALVADYSDPKISVRDVSGNDLSTREARKALLKKLLIDKNGNSIVDFVELSDLLKGTAVPKARIVVVFDNTIDEQGHKVPEQLPLLAGQLTGNLARAVDLLHDAGIETVHTATDHGFLLLPPEEVVALGTPSVPVAQVLKREPRWAALKPDAPTEDVIRLPSPFVPEPNVLGLARGVRTLVQPEPYLHGGLSLQECVVPHVVSRSTFRATKVGVKLDVTKPNLTVGTVPVILRPVLPAEQQSFGGVQPLKLLLWVETVAEAGSESRQVTDRQPVELRPDVEELKPAVYLQEGLGLANGQKLVLRAVDAENGRDLGKVPLTLLVDWE